MKHLLIALICLCLASPSLAQQRTLADQGFVSGGYGGPLMHYSSVKGNNALFMGGEGAWIANKTFLLGGGGWALISNIAADKLNPSSTGNLEFSCGGIKLGWIFNSDELTHFVIHSLIGWGQAAYKPPGTTATTDNSNFTVLEPGVDYEINITPNFRLALSSSYRIISGVDSTPGLKDSDLSGMAFGVVFKFGSFGRSE
ncbi:MAG: hypothetical protein JW782_02755 [Candidatus Saganbacteria bacterium]|nr:hypothetical protein [Candidatus Saganbacteria bacterium]